MIDWLRKKFFNKYLGSVVRTVLAALGGYLIKHYGLDENLVEQFITSFGEVLVIVLPLVVAQIWSLFQKKGSEEIKPEF